MDTELDILRLNLLTKEQFDAASKTPNELYLLKDGQKVIRMNYVACEESQNPELCEHTLISSQAEVEKMVNEVYAGNLDWKLSVENVAIESYEGEVNYYDMRVGLIYPKIGLDYLNKLADMLGFTVPDWGRTVNVDSYLCGDQWSACISNYVMDTDYTFTRTAWKVRTIKPGYHYEFNYDIAGGKFQGII